MTPTEKRDELIRLLALLLTAVDDSDDEMLEVAFGQIGALLDDGTEDRGWLADLGRVLLGQ